MPIKLYPSSYTPIFGQTTNAAYKEGCLRFMAVRDLVTAADPKSRDIDSLYSAIGRICEERFLTMHENEDGGFYDREFRVLEQLDASGNMLSGKVDFLFPDRIVEIKGSISASKRAMWRKGTPDPAHLGQLVTYMIALKRSKGLLFCSYMHFNNPPTQIEFEPFEFYIELLPDGEHFSVNGVMQDTTLQDVLKFYALAIDAIQGAHLPPMPVTTRPCQTCPFQAVCANSPQDRTSFIREVEHVLAEAALSGILQNAMPTPRIKCHNRRKTNDKQAD